MDLLKLSVILAVATFSIAVSVSALTEDQEYRLIELIEEYRNTLGHSETDKRWCWWCGGTTKFKTEDTKKKKPDSDDDDEEDSKRSLLDILLDNIDDWDV